MEALTHLMPAITRHSDSPAAAWNAVAARMPGATNTRYSTPSTVPWFSSTRPAEADAHGAEEQQRHHHAGEHERVQHRAEHPRLALGDPEHREQWTSRAGSAQARHAVASSSRAPRRRARPVGRALGGRPRPLTHRASAR